MKNTEQTAARTFVMRVARFLIHMHPHLDEVLGRLLIVMYGKERFVGAETATVFYVEGDVAGTDRTFDRDGDVPIGISDSRFNEHRGPDERLDGECATTLIAKELGIEKLPELELLIDSTLHYDSHPWCPSTHMSELVKAANRILPDDSAAVMQWATTGLEAVIVRKKYSTAPSRGELTLPSIFKSLKDKGEYTDPKALAYMEEQIAWTMDHSDHVAELSFAVASMCRRQAYTEEQVIQWVKFALDNMYADQLVFQEKLDAMKAIKPIKIQAQLHSRGKREVERELDLFVCYDDSPQAQKAARVLGADLVLQVSPSGNMQIFCNNRIRGLSLANVVKMIRWLELPMEAKRRARWSELSMPGTYPGVEHWYFFQKGQMLFNGSLTKVAPPTKISLQAIVEILQHAFHEGGVDLWCSTRREIMERSAERPIRHRQGSHRRTTRARETKGNDQPAEPSAGIPHAEVALAGNGIPDAFKDAEQANQARSVASTGQEPGAEMITNAKPVKRAGPKRTRKRPVEAKALTVAA